MQTRNDAFVQALQFGDGVYIQPQFNTAVIPEFSYGHTETVATILAEYPLENTSAVSIRLPLPQAVTENETFGLCARYTEGSTTFRYVLHKPAWYDGILFPEYTGQKLGPSATLEVWALANISPAAIDEDIELTVGPLIFQTPGQIATCGQLQGESTTLTATVI